MKPIKRVMAAVDFSDNSLAAFDRAADLACRMGAALCVLTVVDSPRWKDAVPADAGGVIQELTVFFEDRMRLLTESSDGFSKIPVRVLVRRGRPLEEILAAADEEDIDIIVMGTHGRRGVIRALMGSVAEGVIRAAGRPVMVVSEGQGARMVEVETFRDMVTPMEEDRVIL